MSKDMVTKPVTSEPIRVMHIIDKLGVSGSSIHGITQVLAQSTPLFDSSQFQITVCSLRLPEPAGDVLQRAGVPTYFLGRGRFDLRTFTDLLRLVKQKRPHILHLHGFGAGNFGRVVSLFTGLPNIVHEHVVITHQPLYQTIMETLLSPLTTRAIAISEPVRQYMVKYRKIQPQKLETFFYGLPLSKFQPPSPQEVLNMRNTLGIRPDEQIVCNVGRLDTQKGQMFLIEAARLILAKRPHTRFLLVGDGPDRQKLESAAQSANIAEQIIFTGFRTDVSTLISLSDVFAIPSLWEGGPITLFEAMILRKPVVGTPVGLMGEVIQDGKTGFLVPCENATVLADRLLTILDNPELSRTMGEKGWEVCQQYDISCYVQRLEEIYRALHHSYSE
jgi:glycosyltransferase involved in cell wall biosynthesis